MRLDYRGSISVQELPRSTQELPQSSPRSTPVTPNNTHEHSTPLKQNGPKLFKVFKMEPKFVQGFKMEPKFSGALRCMFFVAPHTVLSKRVDV